jgi:hypothetical protein
LAFRVCDWGVWPDIPRVRYGVQSNQACPPVALILSAADAIAVCMESNHACPPSGAIPTAARATAVPIASTPATTIQALFS